MKIQTVTFLGVRGIADATFDLTDPRTGAPHDVVLITGPSGSGKTRFLEAIAVAKEVLAPTGPAQPSVAWIGGDGTAAKIALSFHLDEEERLYAGAEEAAAMDAEVAFFPNTARNECDEGLAAVLERYDHREGIGKIEYFPASRRVPAYAPFHGTGPFEQRPLRARKDPRKYSFIPRFLQEIEGRPDDARAFAERLAALSDTVRWERGRPARALPRCFSSRGGPLATIAELSDGEVDAVVFAAAATAIQLVRSILLIDRPEIAVAPPEIPGFLAGLRALGPDNQLLLASSSPAVRAALPGAAVVELRPA